MGERGALDITGKGGKRGLAAGASTCYACSIFSSVKSSVKSSLRSLYYIVYPCTCSLYLLPVLGPLLGPLSRVDAWSAFTSPILLRFSTLHIVHILYIYYSTFSVSDAIICAAYLIRHDYDSI